MHTAPATVTPESESSPDQSGTPQQPPHNGGGGARPSWPRSWMVVVTVGVILGAVLLLVVRGRSPKSASRAPSSGQNPGQVLRLKGTTEAVQSRAIVAPLLAGQQVETLTIVRLTTAGTRVKKGDLLVEFDRQAQMRDFVDKQAEYNKLVEQVEEEKAKESAARAKDETELKTAEDDLRKAELEIQKAEIVSRIDAEKNQETLDEAKATFEQLQQTFDLKRKAALAAIRTLEIQRDRTQQTMLHAQSNSDLMRITSPLDGVVVLNTIWKQGIMGEVQEGDQVRPGVPFMQVVNPSAMQVRVLANQQDFPNLQLGSPAKVRMDAYPDLVFPARVEQMAPIGERGSFSNKVRVFAVIISIQGSDPKLMPDLSAAVDVDVTGPGAGSASVASTKSNDEAGPQ
jgi:HlyD family secretion protein